MRPSSNTPCKANESFPPLTLCPMTIPFREYCSCLFTCLPPCRTENSLGEKPVFFRFYVYFYHRAWNRENFGPIFAVWMILSLQRSMKQITPHQDRAAGVGIFRGDIHVKKWSLSTDHIQVILFLSKAKKAYKTFPIAALRVSQGETSWQSCVYHSFFFCTVKNFREKLKWCLKYKSV